MTTAGPLALGVSLTHSGADEGRRVADVLQTLALDEVGHAIGEAVVVGLHVVLQDQAAQGAGRLVWGGGGGGGGSIFTVSEGISAIFPAFFFLGTM